MINYSQLDHFFCDWCHHYFYVLTESEPLVTHCTHCGKYTHIYHIGTAEIMPNSTVFNEGDLIPHNTLEGIHDTYGEEEAYEYAKLHPRVK
jgi:hypothetical protein